MRLTIIIAAALALLTPMGAAARDWPETAGWTILEGASYCAMTNEFEGPGDSELYLIMRTDGLVLLADVNSQWSSKEDEVYDDITAVMDGTTYGGSKAVGMSFSGKNGFAVALSPRMVDDVAKARSIRLYKGETKIDHLNLSGTAAAIAVTRRCLATLRSADAAAERERRRYADMPADPFAK